ncbi:MAG: diphosphomevalonate decarboxylase [bacterium]
MTGSTAAVPVAVRAFANLALVKYWGKSDRARNLPATPSIGVNLEKLSLETVVRPAQDERNVDIDPKEILVVVNGTAQPTERYAPFVLAFREATGYEGALEAVSSGSFPQGAGLASSAAGFAALAVGCAEVAARNGCRRLNPQEISAVARVGSGSAARAVVGGFSLLPAGGAYAYQIAPADAWPQLRIVVALVTTAEKATPSRDAMETTRRTSPYYPAWVQDAAALAKDAEARIAARDLEGLGELMRLSYLRMHATMLASRPPVRYWLPGSMEVLALCEELRGSGVAAFETMDAGPQVKILTTAEDAARVVEALGTVELAAAPLVSRITGAPRVLSEVSS